MQEKRKIGDTPLQEQNENTQTGVSIKAIRQSVIDNLYFHLGKLPEAATRNDWYMAVAHTIRDRMLERWIRTLKTFTEDVTVVGYLSSEFLIGPQLGNNLINIGVYDKIRQAVKQLGLDLDELARQEEEPGLGNGVLGILAACSIDSLATLEIPAIGYGIRYEFGSFSQEIRDGWQAEVSRQWLKYGNPWEFPRPDINYSVNLGGRTESYYDEQDCFRVRWVPKFSIKGVAHDTPISGYQVSTTNLLRLWKSEAVESFDTDAMNSSDYFSALSEKIASESIGKILYPDDEPYAGKHLRLAQQYFLVSCSLQDMIRLHLLRWKNIYAFSNSFAIHLNDTHCAIAVAELMRLLVDEHLVSWDKAWYITQNTFSYTNHTALPEVLEKWPLPLFAGILPRHLEIIYEINRRFLDEIWLKYPDDDEKLARVSLIDESDQKYVRVVHLACLGSRSINGISEMQSGLLKNTLLPDFYKHYPERFLNITNGVTPRRWIVLSNPQLTELITEAIGDNWIGQFEELKKLELYANDLNFINKWQSVKREKKYELAEIIHERTGNTVNPDTLFDIHIKRVHEFKRQHLNVLHIIRLYQRIKKNPRTDVVPRTFIFGGKASPGYFMAKLIIKLINSVAEVVNNDPDVAGRLNVVFFPDFNVKDGQMIYPAADLSEQISVAGREPSETGNLKFSMNGALTIGTFNGANIEICEAVGKENFFLIGLKPEEVVAAKSQDYNPMVLYDANPDLKETIDLISSGFFSQNDLDLFKPLVDSLLCRDEHMIFADYQSYIDCQDRISLAFMDPEKWTKMSILTVARMAKFSSDRAIREYCEKIWHAAPLKIDLGDA